MQHSILDLAPVPEGTSTAQALKNSVDLARHAERWGYHRFWLAEHHNMPGIASAATAVMVGHVAGATKTIRVGSGGIMLPNHSPLAVAEAFGTLATLYPDRIDLGLGRAPGGDHQVARALRRGSDRDETFPSDVEELIGYLGDGEPSAAVRALPGQGTRVPVWILGSSLFGAQLAAHFGLPYAFASHFAPDALEQAVAIYRRTFRPVGDLAKPRFMLAANVFAGETDEEGAYLRTSMQQAFARLRTGCPGLLPRPVNDIESEIGRSLAAGVNAALRIQATGSPRSVGIQLRELVARYEPDELILTSQIHDHRKRLRSLEIAATCLDGMKLDQAA